MGLIANEYGRYSVTDNDRFLAALGITVGNRDAKGREEERTATVSEADATAFSEKAMAMAARKTRSAGELEGLAYEPLLSFATEDGGDVSVEAAWSEGEGEKSCTALKISVTKADGEVEVIYLDYAEADAAREEEQAVTNDAAGQTAQEMAIENAASLTDAIARRGLDKTDGDGTGMLDVIRARIKAMEEAARQTRELEAGYADLRESREQRLAALDGSDGPDAAVADRGNERTGSVWTYTRRGYGSTVLTEVRSTGYSRKL